MVVNRRSRGQDVWQRCDDEEEYILVCDGGCRRIVYPALECVGLSGSWSREYGDTGSGRGDFHGGGVFPADPEPGLFPLPEEQPP